MMQKTFERTGALDHADLMFAAKMNRFEIRKKLKSLRGETPVRKKRTGFSGGMFTHNSRTFRHV